MSIINCPRCATTLKNKDGFDNGHYTCPECPKTNGCSNEDWIRIYYYNKEMLYYIITVLKFEIYINIKDNTANVHNFDLGKSMSMPVPNDNFIYKSEQQMISWIDLMLTFN